MAPSGIGNYKLPAYVRALPIGHLQLQIYTADLVRRYATIGRFVEELAGGKKSLTRLASGREHKSVSKLLVQSRKRGGALDWDAFRQARPFKIRQGIPLYFFSEVLDKLKPNQSCSPITRLHLSRRTLNALLREKIPTVKELHNRTRKGLGPIQAVGRKGSVEILEALTAVSMNVGKTGDIDWTGYAKSRGYLILPRRSRDCWSPRAFIRELPAVVEAAVKNRYGVRAATIFRQRSLSNAEAASFAQIGSRLGQTKQHTNLIEKRTLRMLRRVLLRDEYHDYKFQIESAFSQPLLLLARTIDITASGVISFRIWNRELQRAWGLGATELGEAERLISQLLGIRLVFFKAVPSKPLLLTSSFAGSVRRALLQIEHALTRVFPNGLSSDRLQTFLRHRMGSDAPAVTDLSPLLQSISGLEMCNGIWRAELSRLTRISDRCERILRQEGKPIHLRDIARALDPEQLQSNSRFARRLSSLLGTDERFIPVARSGRWALRVWPGIETRSVSAIATDLLRSARHPLAEDELWDVISRMRTVTKDALRFALKHHNQFAQTASGKWQRAD